MTRFPIVLVSTQLALVFNAGALTAGEPSPDELRSKAEQLQREAEMLFQHAEEMERSPRPGPFRDGHPAIEQMHEKIGHLKEKGDQLRRQGRHDEAQSIQREVEEIRRKIEEMERSHRPDAHHQGLQHDPDHRVRILNEAAEHMREAASRLHEVNMHELADRLTHDAEMVHQEAGRQMHDAEMVHQEADKQMHDRDSREPIDQIRGEIEQLRQDLDRLRDQVNTVLDRLNDPR